MDPGLSVETLAELKKQGYVYSVLLRTEKCNTLGHQYVMSWYDEFHQQAQAACGVTCPEAFTWTGRRFWFKRAEDAVLFALRWA